MKHPETCGMGGIDGIQLFLGMRQDTEGHVRGGIALYIRWHRINEDIRVFYSPIEAICMEILGPKCYWKVAIYCHPPDIILEADLELEKKMI